MLKARPIPQGSGIRFAEGEPVRARGMDAPSQRKNFNHRACPLPDKGNALSISRINQPKFGGGLNFEPDAGTLVKN